ncbi:Laminin beta chain, partial [Fasciolopsis buskii]
PHCHGLSRCLVSVSQEILLLANGTVIHFFTNAEEYSCENTICNPRAGDLLIGRESSLWASSTCGLQEVEAYCVVTTSDKSFCKECTSSQPYNAITNPESHRIENVVSRVPSNPGRWWQSQNGLHNVSIQLNLDTQFQFISTILRFKTYRPAAMYLERSYDFGRTWKRYAYFSNDCKRDFPAVPEGTRKSLTDVTCTGVYSQLTPSEGGVVAYMAAPSEMHESWPQYSKERMNLTAITNLRAVFTRLNTLGCNCNNHASACYFNPVLYIKSGNVSGGNCHGCEHNTEGPNCEFCQPNFYRHPSYPIDHPSTCQPCNCHTDGTLYGGFCQQYTIPEQNLVAGRCLCKKNVGGEKCDRCKVGHWNFQATNPEGCEACSCNMMGTLDNGGCDPYTGLCTCKRFVGGPNCDQCLEGYFNLTMAPLGCQECACSQLGSKNAVCDRISGQCECKVGFTGRDCGQVEDGYFVLPPHEVIDRPGEKEITLDGPRGEGRFVIVLDVDPKQFGEGDRWTIIVKPYQHGATRCQNPSQTVNVYQDTSKIIISDVCLEAGLPIVLRIMPESQPSGPYTEILITDIVLVPTDDSGLARRCEIFRELAMEILSGRRDDRTGLPAECEVYFRLPRVSWRETGSSAEPCSCNITGSYTDVCDKATGQCPCKPGVVGRRCDQCALYHYDFSANGCKNCSCDPQGSVTLQCNLATSLCDCRPGIMGKHCDICKPGSWDFPVCRPCVCNGFSDICDQKTGRCEGCAHNTGGHNCEKCREGFYGDPLRGTPCKPCSCPGGGLNHASECIMGSLQEQICYCKPGYTGTRCSECAVNHYGNPTELGGSCRPCQCSGNIALNEPGGCDPITGRCLKCLHDSEGYNCEICRLGFWGDATRQMCQPCNCFPPGTADEGKTGCNRGNGQCPCLPNVVGARCYECSPGYFNLTSGRGCEPCQCDMSGSLDQHCDSVNGQCRCKSDRSGRKCDQCRRLFYGSPHHPDGCKPCDCDPRGSLGDSCDPQTGQCMCRNGIAGRRCDQCDRGTQGILPHCQPCGECWTDWDKAIDNVIAELDRLQNQTGRQLPPDLTVLFDSLVRLLEQIENMPWMKADDAKIQELGRTLTRTENVIKVLSALDSSPDSLTALEDALPQQLNDELTRFEQVSLLKQRLNDLNTRLSDLIEEASELQRQNPVGANMAVQKSLTQAQKVKEVQRQIDAQKSLLESRGQKLAAEVNAVKNRANALVDGWAQLDRRIGEFRDEIRQINRLLCGDNGIRPEDDADPKVCPSSCGGAACDPVTRWIGLKTLPQKQPPQSLVRRARFTRDISGSIVTDSDYWTGLLGGCGVSAGCDASIGGRLRNLMEQYLELQIQLVGAVQAVYRAESLILKVSKNV